MDQIAEQIDPIERTPGEWNQIGKQRDQKKQGGASGHKSHNATSLVHEKRKNGSEMVLTNGTQYPFLPNSRHFRITGLTDGLHPQ